MPYAIPWVRTGKMCGMWFRFVSSDSVGPHHLEERERLQRRDGNGGVGPAGVRPPSEVVLVARAGREVHGAAKAITTR